jgi:RNA polymerase sigma-70 factor (ECF subfamily)
MKTVTEPLLERTHPSRMTEIELVDACLNENRLAQKELYDRYKQAMYTLAFRLTGDLEQAADVLQEAFVKVFRHLPSFRRESTLGAWIKTIVVRTAYSHFRGQKLFIETLDAAHGAEQIDWGAFSNAEYLEKAIMDLPDGYRTVFTLVEVEGYAHKEVAELLGISVGTSKSQLFYAKKRLRETLQAYGY